MRFSVIKDSVKTMKSAKRRHLPLCIAPLINEVKVSADKPKFMFFLASGRTVEATDGGFTND